jgi:hypothetical protein
MSLEDRVAELERRITQLEHVLDGLLHPPDPFAELSPHHRRLLGLDQQP